MSSLFCGQLPICKRTREILLIGMLALCGLAPAQAAPEFDEDDLLELYGDDETVSISTGTSKPVRLAPSVASVITEADILNRGASSLDEVLEMVPGLHVSVSGSNKLNSIYSIRGIHTSQNPQVLLLIDGIPIRQMFFAGRFTNYRLPAANIKRVEVIRGPGSAVYGADAFAGVINVITKSAADIDGLQVGARVGSFDSYEGWAQYGANVGSWQLAAGLEYATGDADDDRVVTDDFQSVFDNVFRTNASRAPGSLNTAYDVLDARVKLTNERWSFSLSSWQNRDAGNGAGSAQALDPVGSTDAMAYQFATSYNGSFAEDWKYEVRFDTGFYDEENDFVVLPAGTLVPIGDDGNLFTPGGGLVLFTDGVRGTPSGQQKTNSLELINRYSGFDKHDLRLAFGYQLLEADARESKNFGPGVLDRESGFAGNVVGGALTNVSDTDNVFTEDLDRNIKFISLQDEWAFARDWELTVGLRYDDYSDFGSTINPRLAIVWATNYNLTSKLLYGRAFRAPSIGEQFNKNNPIVLGNPKIDPETIDTVELAFDYRPNVSTAMKLNLFAYEVSDLIDVVPASQATFRADNAIDQIGYGFEIEYDVEVNSDLDLYGNYSWQRSEDKATDQRVADAPGQQFYLGINWRLMHDWYLSGQMNWVADRKRSMSDTRSEIDDYVSVDMTLRKQLMAKNFEAALVVYNLFDEDIHEPSTFTNVLGSNSIDDFPMEGRRISLELRYKLSN